MLKVSLCTPTFNRRPFIPQAIQCVQHQDYTGPMEWIIVDDGTDPIYDLVAHLPHVKYIRLHKKMPLGYKRNLIHANCTGDILVYMDDDDYYPPTRVSHAVQRLQSSKYLIAGSSIIHIYYHDLGRILEFGPYLPYHATAGTFAFKKELLLQTSYDDEACMAEENFFLKNYSFPLIQLDPKHVILVVCHNYNTVDKRNVIKDGQGKPCSFNIENMITDPTLLQFFKHDILTISYSPGEPSKKTDVVQYQQAMNSMNEFKIKFNNKLFQGNQILVLLNRQHDLLKKYKIPIHY
jgi:glycosyltransferase involved in cell wall biosynthesis